MAIWVLGFIIIQWKKVKSWTKGSCPVYLTRPFLDSAIIIFMLVVFQSIISLEVNVGGMEKYFLRKK